MLVVMTTMFALMFMIVCFQIATVGMFVRMDMVVYMAMRVLSRTVAMLVCMLVLMFV